MNEPDVLTETFVDAGPLFTLLSSIDHQILFGRRGTGKTHALKYLAESMRRNGDIAIYLDARVLGSTGGIYTDPNVPLKERGTRLLVDVLTEITDALERYTLGLESDVIGDESVFPLLDKLADEVTTIRVVGTVEVETKRTDGAIDEGAFGIAATIGSKPSMSMSASDKATASHQTERRVKEVGVEHHRVHFGAVSGLLRDIGSRLPASRIWILLDEWSAIPLELQPMLADFIRRAVLPVQGITVKLGAIEQRSRFRIAVGEGDYLGIEVGADMSADVDLDDFMVFGNDPDRAKNFFRELLFKHLRAVYVKEGRQADAPRTADELITSVFTQRNAFDEFVRAAEGVPRDAINIVSLAVQRANSAAVSVAHVRGAARTWYQRDKENAVADKNARDLLNWVIDEVIGKRRARACLVLQGSGGTSHPLIISLFDSRVLHVVKKGVSAKDQPGVRFDAYALDYGCYVELVSTAKEPKGLFQVENEDASAFVEVPADDYRSIRNAVLDLEAFERRAPVDRPSQRP
ncbi:MAG: hypothetical protein U0169_04560 [Polyangiaceae bacterium]